MGDPSERKLATECRRQSRSWASSGPRHPPGAIARACIQKRLGRAIAIGDVITFPVVEGYPMSDTLHARLFPSKKRRKARASKAVEEGAR